MTRAKYRIEYLDRPGRRLADLDRLKLAAELRTTAATCFEEVPEYQCLRGTREELADKVIAIARRADGRMAGFCSAVLLPVEGVGDVMHLGLTCVRPEDRGGGLTHRLTSKVLVNFLVRHRPLGRLWISNCACVLSSLGNVALHFDAVYPSPLSAARPSPTHRAIAAAIDRLYRDKMYVLPGAEFDAEAFVFRGSVSGTVFQKEASETTFHHRHQALNRFYLGTISFADGDEVLQVGHVSLLTRLRYGWRRRRIARIVERLNPAPDLAADWIEQEA